MLLIWINVGGLYMYQPQRGSVMLCPSFQNVFIMSCFWCSDMATCHFSCHFPVPLALRSSDLTVISAVENDGVAALRTTLEMIRKMGGLKKVQITRTEMEAKVEKLSVASLHGILGNCSFESYTHTHKNLSTSGGCLLSTIIVWWNITSYITDMHRTGSFIHPLRACVCVREMHLLWWNDILSHIFTLIACVEWITVHFSWTCF